MDGAENRKARAGFRIGSLAAVQCPGAQTDDSQPRQSRGDRHLPHAYQDFPSPVWSIVRRTPRHAASPSRPIEYANCGKVGTVQQKYRTDGSLSVTDRKSTRLNSSHVSESRMPPSA